MDITIKNVPEEAEELVRKAAMVSVENFLRRQLVVPKEVCAAVTKSIVDFRASNKGEINAKEN